MRTRFQRIGAIGVGFFLLTQLGVGCLARRLAQDELPESPIAFIHWEDRSASKRSETFSKRDELPRPPESEDPERMEEEQIRAHLRGDEMLAMRAALTKHPSRLMLIWPRTGEIERVEAAPNNAIPLAWSPDRKRLLIASAHRDGKEQLYEYHLDGKLLSRVTDGPAEHPRGDYFPDGRLAIQRIQRRSRVGRSEHSVHVASAGGRLGPVGAIGVPPGTLRALGPDERIVYEQIRPRPRRNGPTVFESLIATRALRPGSEEQILLKGREPVLTPDGQWIVFASESSAGYRLRRMRPDGTSRVPIGPGGTEERMPTVSPDGEFIAFVQLSNERRRLVVRRFDGKDERILLSKGWSEFPVW